MAKVIGELTSPAIHRQRASLRNSWANIGKMATRTHTFSLPLLKGFILDILWLGHGRETAFTHAIISSCRGLVWLPGELSSDLEDLCVKVVI